MIKRTIHLRENADECLKAIYKTYIVADLKSTYSSIISDALEFYFDSGKSFTGQEIENKKK